MKPSSLFRNLCTFFYCRHVNAAFKKKTVAGKGLNSNAPLDTHMNSLRDKYMQMEKKYKKRLRKLEEENDTFKTENKDLTKRLERESQQNLEFHSRIENFETEIEKKNEDTVAVLCLFMFHINLHIFFLKLTHKHTQISLKI